MALALWHSAIRRSMVARISGVQSMRTRLPNFCCWAICAAVRGRRLRSLRAARCRAIFAVTDRVCLRGDGTVSGADMWHPEGTGDGGILGEGVGFGGREGG